MDGAAAESIARLSLTNANYYEAIAFLKSRFGNEQQIINRHMDNLLNHPQLLPKTTLKGLRQLYDSMQSCIRSLRGPSTLTWKLRTGNCKITLEDKQKIGNLTYYISSESLRDAESE